jgi:hypothetical protein
MSILVLCMYMSVLIGMHTGFRYYMRAHEHILILGMYMSMLVSKLVLCMYSIVTKFSK